MHRLPFFAIALLTSLPASAWDGREVETGNSVEIQSGNLVREGLDIEVYNLDTGQYRDVEVQSIYRYGSTVEVEVYDYDNGEYTTLEMDD